MSAHYLKKPLQTSIVFLFSQEETSMNTLSSFPHTLAAQRRGFLGAAGVLAVATLVLFLSACGTPVQASNSQTSAVAVTHVTAQDELAPQTSSATSYLIKVYFSKFGDQDNTKVYAFNRFSPSLAVATYAIQSLIAGPTLSERDAGYYSELNSALSGPSSCNGSHPTGGPDFVITLDKKGNVTQTGTATLKFCRTYTSAGIGTDARIISEINASLKQFSNIKKVVILSQNGHCIGDESGQDLCLK
jgi:hypothetical protein